MNLARLRLPLVLVLTLASGPALAADLVERIVLRVNDEIVTYSEYVARREGRLEGIANAEGLSTDERRKLAADAGRAALRELLDEALVLSRAQQLHIEPSAAELNATLDATRERMGFESEEAFDRALGESGLTRESYKRRIRQNLAFNEVMQREVHSKITLEDDVLLRAYRDSPERWRTPERRRVEELVVVESAAPDASQRAVIAQDLLRALRAGESLQSIAERVSSEVVAGPIDLGWVVAGELAPELDRVVQSLEPGAFSEPVAVRSGLHLVALREVQPAGLQPFEEVKETIRAEESRRLFEERTRDFLLDLERKAYLVENVPEDAVGYREAILEDPEAAGALRDFAPTASRGTAAGAGEAPPEESQPSPGEAISPPV